MALALAPFTGRQHTPARSARSSSGGGSHQTLPPLPEGVPDDLTLKDVYLQVQRLIWLIDGNEDYGILGLRKEQEDTQEKLSKVLEERKQLTWVIRGLTAGLGITTLGAVTQLLPQILSLLSSIK